MMELRGVAVRGEKIRSNFGWEFPISEICHRNKTAGKIWLGLATDWELNVIGN